MDACYGGLALTRKTLPPGSMRLLKDMLQRFSRQVLTAGKADETVSDGGGVRVGHSIFTSHLLDALEGAASATEGVITANGVMAYVYDKVGNDPLSQQTPHYGFLEGDGDFIFAPFVEPSANTAKDEPVLIQTPSFGDLTVPPAEETFSERLKQLIADPAEKIRLDDFVSAHLRRTVQALGLDKFPVQGGFPSEEFAERIKAYEQVIADLEVAVILLSRWARPEQVPMLEKIFARLAEADKGQQGSLHWIHLGWYPILLFDQFEVLLALTFADVRAGDPIDHVWGPPGRFAWQHERYGDQTPFARVVAEAQRQNNNWGPLKAGMFGRSIERFKALSTEYGHLLDKIGWW